MTNVVSRTYNENLWFQRWANYSAFREIPYSVFHLTENGIYSVCPSLPDLVIILKFHFDKKLLTDFDAQPGLVVVFPIEQNVLRLEVPVNDSLLV